MKTSSKIITSLAVAGILGAGAFAFNAHAQERGFGHRRGFWAGKFAGLGITMEQKEQIHAILKKHQPATQPKMQEFAAAQRELRKLIHAEKVDEAAIRAQVDKLAKLGADLAVERARVAQEIRPLLTTEQIKRLQDMKLEAEARAEGMRAYVAKRIAGE